MKRNRANDDNNVGDNTIISSEILEGMGISAQAYEEAEAIIGRVPTLDELSTLLAMWQSQGGRQSLLSWLRMQPHTVERHDYIVSELEPESKEVREPRVKECIEIATTLFGKKKGDAEKGEGEERRTEEATTVNRGDEIYMVGDVSEFFVDSVYGREVLHLASDSISYADEREAREYIDMILLSLQANGTVIARHEVGAGGLFGALLGCTRSSRRGFDILTCREVRTDAFLFGEQGARHVAILDEAHEDFFIQKLGEARLNCCFLGRVTANRITVDGIDFGRVERYKI